LTPALIKTAPRPARQLVGKLDQREPILWLIGDAQKPQRPEMLAGKTDTKGQTLLDLCSDGIVLVDEHGKIITSNAAGLRILGLEGQNLDGQILGLPLSSGMAVNLAKVSGKPIDVSMVERQWNGNPAYVITMRDLGDLHARDGHVEPTVHEIRDEELAGVEPEATQKVDELLQTNAMLTKTIAESTIIMRDLRAAHDELGRSNGELQSFAHRVAHDFKAPLRNISQANEFVLEDERDRITEESRDRLVRTAETIKRLDTLLDSLLAFARVGSQQNDFTEVDLNNVLKWVTSDLEPTIKATFGVCDVGRLPIVMGDAGELYQLFLNLIGNAIKYRRPSIPPIVTVKMEPGAECSSDQTAMTRIFVSDNGIGFDEDQVEKIFEPFTRLVGKKDVEGSGIGLATVKKIVTRHGSTIKANSKAGEGATFTIELQPQHQSPP